MERSTTADSDGGELHRPTVYDGQHQDALLRGGRTSRRDQTEKTEVFG